MLSRLLGVGACVLSREGDGELWQVFTAALAHALAAAQGSSSSLVELAASESGAAGAGGRCDADEPRARYVRDLLDARLGSRGHATEGWGLAAGSRLAALRQPFGALGLGGLLAPALRG